MSEAKGGPASPDPAAFLIITDVNGDEMDEDVLGPFPDHDAAGAFAREHALVRPPDGGQRHVAIISALSSTPPGEWLARQAPA